MKLLRAVVVCLLAFLCLIGCAVQPVGTQSAPAPATELDRISSEETSSAWLTDRVALLSYPQTGQELAFRTPAAEHYAIADMLYDAEGETYAVVYAVSDYKGDKPWLIFYEDNATLQIQLFAKQGEYIKHISTEFVPVTNGETEVVSSGPCYYKNGLLTFFTGWVIPEYIFFDTTTNAYTSLIARRCAIDGDYFLFSDEGLKDRRNTSLYTFSLYHRETPVASVDILNENFAFAQRNDPEMPDDVLDIFTLDGDSKTGVVSSGILTYTLDFNTKTWKMDRSYSKENLDDLLAVSADSRWEVYLAGLFGAGDAFSADIVAYDTKSGQFTYLSEYGGGTAVFGAGSRLLFNHQLRLELIDVQSAQVLDDQFAIDCEAKDCFVTGIAYDAKKDWFLVAYRSPKFENDWDKKLPVMLDVYDGSGRLINTMDTGCTVAAFEHNHVVRTTLALDGKGTVTISDYYEELGSAQYYS